MTDYLEYGGEPKIPKSNAAPAILPNDFYSGPPASVAARERAFNDKIQGHRVFRAIKKFIIKAIFWPIAIAAGTLLVMSVLESAGIPVFKYVKNAYHNVKHDSEQKRMDELTRQKQREEFEKKRKAEEQKKLDEKRQDGDKKNETDGENKKNKPRSINWHGKDALYKSWRQRENNFAHLKQLPGHQNRQFAKKVC